jgi:hypothetical protein
MIQYSPSQVVHLELHSGNWPAPAASPRACAAGLEQVEVGDRSYQAFDWGGGLEGGGVATSRIDEATECARRFDSSVLLQPREGAHQETTPPSSADESLALRTDRIYPPRPMAHSDLTGDEFREASWS